MSEPIKDLRLLRNIQEMLHWEDRRDFVSSQNVAYEPRSKELIVDGKYMKVSKTAWIAKKKHWDFFLIMGNPLAVYIMFKDLEDLGVKVSQEQMPEHLFHGMRYIDHSSNTSLVKGFSIVDETDRAIFLFHYASKIFDPDKVNGEDLEDEDRLKQMGIDWDDVRSIQALLKVAIGAA